MDINSLAGALFNVVTLYICLAVYVITYLIRATFEGTWRILVQQGEIKKGSVWGRMWSEVIVPVLPILVGGCLGFAVKTFMMPDFAMKTKLARVLYGAICGLFSAFIYNRIRGWLNSKVGGGKADGVGEAGSAAEPLTLPSIAPGQEPKSEPPKTAA
jgi:hypothetical protein